MLDPRPQILRATPADAQALSRLSAAVFPLGCPANTPSHDLADYISREHTPKRYRDLLHDDRFVILVAKVADTLAGLLFSRRRPLRLKSNPHPHLNCEGFMSIPPTMAEAFPIF